MAAAIELYRDTVETPRRPETVADLLKTAPLVLESSCPLLEASALLGDSPSRAALVLDETGRVAGLLTTERVLHELVELGAHAEDLRVKTLMQTELPSIPLQMGLREAWALLGNAGDSHALVSSSGGLCLGSVSHAELRDHAFALLESLS